MFFYYLATYSDSALLLLRLAFGTVVLEHALPQLKQFKAGAVLGTLGALALIFGFLTQPVAAIFAIVFVIALVRRVFRKEPSAGDWERELLLLAMALLLLAVGPGDISADNSGFLSGF